MQYQRSIRSADTSEIARERTGIRSGRSSDKRLYGAIPGAFAASSSTPIAIVLAWEVLMLTIPGSPGQVQQGPALRRPVLGLHARVGGGSFPSLVLIHPLSCVLPPCIPFLLSFPPSFLSLPSRTMMCALQPLQLRPFTPSPPAPLPLTSPVPSPAGSSSTRPSPGRRGARERSLGHAPATDSSPLRAEGRDGGT